MESTEARSTRVCFFCKTGSSHPPGTSPYLKKSLSTQYLACFFPINIFLLQKMVHLPVLALVWKDLSFLFTNATQNVISLLRTRVCERTSVKRQLFSNPPQPPQGSALSKLDGNSAWIPVSGARQCATYKEILCNHPDVVLCSRAG